MTPKEQLAAWDRAVQQYREVERCTNPEQPCHCRALYQIALVALPVWEGWFTPVEVGHGL